MRLIFYNTENTPGLKDATGAFDPEAKRFVKVHNALDATIVNHLVPLKNRSDSLPAVRQMVLDKIRSTPGPLDALVFFCHGWPTRIGAGFSFRNVSLLVNEVIAKAVGNLRVLLYCCSTAEGPADESKGLGPGTDGGFADILRDRLCAANVCYCRIMAHKVSGHTSQNPKTVFFDGDGTLDGKTEDSYIGGQWVISPQDPLWKKWKAALKTDFRFTFPFMTIEEIKAYLG